MRAIVKGAEPTSLRAYRAAPGATYDGQDFTEVKDDLRQVLVRDQRGLCCYCTVGIAPEAARMKVEHWKPQSRFPELQLAWKNLLGACLGNPGSRPKSQTCDTFKGDREIKLDPQNPDHIATLRCRSNGRIYSTDKRLQADIEEGLNLNTERLVNERRQLLSRFTNLLEKSKGEKISKSELDRAVRYFEEQGKPHCGAFRLWALRRGLLP